ncbi:serine/arginine repetitive matrix protein 2-like isoform X2 [Anneissia japonica]|uniref:serine/arginine repetitive matrix protein 2-like isoform X2 n=1 Tax=Anneissia japonica TaxID=1529436 RepID=UPI001425604D|nr:serine/arginine repetitive matrix protein 2-like isoform X2 [Anneissia japonica]
MGYSKFSAIFKKTRYIESRNQDQLKRGKLQCDGVNRDPVVVPQPPSKGSTGKSGNTGNERLTRRSYSMTSKITRQPSFGKSGLPIPKARNANANEKDTVSPVENGLAEENKDSSLLRPRNRNSIPVMSPKDISSKSESVHDRLATRSNSASRRSCSACNMDFKTSGNTLPNSIDNDSKKSIKSPTSGNMSRLAAQKSGSPSLSHEKRLVNGHVDASVRPKVKKSPTVSPYLSKPSLPPKPRRKTMESSPSGSREEKSRQKPSEGNLTSETNLRTYNGDLRESSAGRGNGKSPASNRRHTLGCKPAVSAKPLVSPCDRRLERPSSLYQRRGTESNETIGEKRKVTPERSRHRLPTSLSSKSPGRIDTNSSPTKPLSVRPKSSFSPGSNLRSSGRFTDASQDRTHSAPSSHVRFRSAGRTGVDKRDPSHSPKLRRKDVKRSQSLGPADRKGKRSSIPGFVARCRQAWEDNVLKPLSKEKGAEDVKQPVVSPDNLRRMGAGRRSLVEMRKAMLFSSDTERESRSKTGIKHRDVKSVVSNGESKVSEGKVKSQVKKENIRESRIARPDFISKRGNESSDDASENRPVEIASSSNSQIENSNSKSELQSEVMNCETEPQNKPVVLQENYLNQNVPVQERKVSLIDDKIAVREKENIVIVSEGNNNDSKKNQLQKPNETINSSNEQLDNKDKDGLIIKSNVVDPKRQEGPAIVEMQQEASPVDKGEQVKDGHYFLRVVNGQQSRIEDLCQRAEKNLEKELTDEVCGIIRSAIGKASLLTNKKFKQFRGLCEKNINQSDDEQFKTMPMDLVGFWEMVMLQVEDVERLFQEVDNLEKNGWVLQQPTVITQKKAKAKVSKSTDGNMKSERNIKMEQARKAREESRRKLIAEKRAAAKRNALAAAAEENAVVEIFVPEKK